ncbi:hypothetical protein TRICI_004907 [Trichomonascus ciferrii]|uniref:Uncharacterized protein n=1 Tax=Trichomonascus ciferrii TaxID=44093 RepID=A0A642V2R8_9ASCO|nr:hypothetical protein TRICI_004907 [Trichomonascus ciferrii]
MNKGEKRTKPRPPKLELDKANKAGPGEGASSASSLRTPKEIAHDIAIQCVSPGIGPFTGGISEETRDAVMISKSVEAEQRKLIAERMGQDGTLTPKSATTKMVEIEQIDNGQLSPNNLAHSGSLKRSMKRKEPPKRLELKHTSPLKYSGINSAPLARTMTDKSYITSNNNAFGGRSASNPVYGPTATQHTVYVRNRVKEDGAQSALPLRNNNWTGLQHHTRSRSDDPEKTTTSRQSDDEDDEDEDDDSDPEDKALSDQDKKQSTTTPNTTEKKQPLRPRQATM